LAFLFILLFWIHPFAIALLIFSRKKEYQSSSGNKGGGRRGFRDRRRDGLRRSWTFERKLNILTINRNRTMEIWMSGRMGLKMK
jgi:hypothetical protein